MICSVCGLPIAALTSMDGEITALCVEVLPWSVAVPRSRFCPGHPAPAPDPDPTFAVQPPQMPLGQCIDLEVCLTGDPGVLPPIQPVNPYYGFGKQTVSGTAVPPSSGSVINNLLGQHLGDDADLDEIDMALGARRITERQTVPAAFYAAFKDDEEGTWPTTV